MNAGLDGAVSALRAQFAQFARFTQDTRLLQLTTPLGADALLVECIDGSEGLSEGFRFVITVLSTDARVDAQRLLGQPALSQILTQRGRTALRPLHGHMTVVEAVSADGGFARYRLTLEPWLSFLRHRRDSYVWQGKSVPDIVQDIFSDYREQGALAPAWRLDLADPRQYPPREVCTQFEESDLAFVERLLGRGRLVLLVRASGRPGRRHAGRPHAGDRRP